MGDWEMIKIKIEELNKSRTKGAKDKTERKKKSLRNIISSAFSGKKKEEDKNDQAPQSIDERLRNLKRAQKHHPRR